MSSALKVAFVSTEFSPYAKSGELADVASSLPKYLTSLGIEVSVFMPKYRRAEIDSAPKELEPVSLEIPLDNNKAKAQVYRTDPGKFPLYFIDSPKYFWRENIYGEGKGEYLDNDERFIFFNKAVLAFLQRTRMKVDVIHCHSWPTALIPVLVKTIYNKKGTFKRTATVLTLHNISYQGEFPPESLALTGLNWNYFSSGPLSLNGRLNFLKAGIIYADMLNTVSSSYRREILTKKGGKGLNKILQARKESLVSIRNGVDYELWDPRRDPFIISTYNPGDLEAKKKCKVDALREFGLPSRKKSPIIGVSSFLAAHKGIDILLEAMEELLQMDVMIIVVAQGDELYANSLLNYQKKFPKKLAVRLEMSPASVHKLAAGADMFLIPSLSEPCGLNQLYGFRYGTVPIVRATGGLKETVKPFDLKTKKGNGFIFEAYSASSLLSAVRLAVECYKQSAVWERIVKNGIKEKFSWEKAAKKYIRLYQEALRKKTGGENNG